MDSISVHRGRSPEDAGVVVLRITRLMPVTIPVPMRIEPRVSGASLAVRPTARLAVGGAITAEGFGARLTYRHLEPGSVIPVEEVTSERIALLHNRTLAFQPRAFDRSTATLPDLWIQFLNGSGAPISAATRLGRCDQGPFELCPELTLGLSVDAVVLKTESFDPYAPPALAITGDVSIRTGVVARISLAEGGGPPAYPGESTAPADVSIFPGGTEVQLPRRTLRGPLGRDSWIFLTFLNGAGQSTGTESLLGRAQPGADGSPMSV